MRGDGVRRYSISATGKGNPHIGDKGLYSIEIMKTWPAPGSEDTELGVLMELEVGHGETEVYARVQA